MTNYNQQPPRILGYWLGYAPTAPNGDTNPTLEQIPDCVDVVILAFALVRPGNVIDTTFMLKPPNGYDSIKAGVAALKARGKTVLLLVGGWGGNCWNNIDNPKLLAASIMALVNMWDLDGIDIDFEGDQPLSDWTTVPACASQPHPDPTTMLCTLLSELRTALGPNRFLTAVTAGGDPYITQSLDLLNWVSTMDYGISGLYTSMAQAYANANPGATFVPFVLGVSCNDPQMPLSDIQQFCTIQPPAGTLTMQMWNLCCDNPDYTGDPIWTYIDTIDAGLPG